MIKKIKIYIQELRAPFLTVTIIPVIIGTLLAKQEGINFKLSEFIFILFGFVFLHLGTNVINDFFDYINGTDNINKNFISPFTGGSRLIQQKILDPKEILIESIILYIFGIIFFIPLIIKFKLSIILVLFFSLIAGIFYTAPPFKWAHLGLGEFLIFLCFGPLMVVTSYYVQGGSNFLLSFLISLPIGLLAASIIDINEFPDYIADKQTGKRNIIVRMGTEKGKFTYLFMVLVSYFLILAFVYLKYLSYAGLIILLILPVSIKAINVLFKHHNSPEKLAPACGMTILSHFLTGLVIILSITLK